MTERESVRRLRFRKQIDNNSIGRLPVSGHALTSHPAFISSPEELLQFFFSALNILFFSRLYN